MNLSEGCVSMIQAYDAYLTPQHLVLSLEPVLGGTLRLFVEERTERRHGHRGMVLGEDEARYFFQVNLCPLLAHIICHACCKATTESHCESL